MQTIARRIANPSTNPEGFDYRKPIQEQVNRGLPEGAALVTDLIPALPQAVDLVVSFNATDAALFGIEFFTSTPEGSYWTPAALPVDDPDGSLSGALEVPAAEQRVYRLTMPENCVGFRFRIRAVRACNRVDVFTQFRKAAD